MTREDGSTTGRRYHHGDLRSALISAAAGLLERDGVEGLSFRAVARAAGVSQAAPYNHFAGKDHLLATVAEAGFHALESSQLAAAALAPSGYERVIRLGLDYIRYAIAHPQLYRLMFGVGIASWCAYPSVAEAKAATFGPIRAALAAHLGGDTPPETLEAAAIAAWALVHGMSMLKIDGSLVAQSGTDALKRESDALRLFATGLRPACALHGRRDDSDGPH